MARLQPARSASTGASAPPSTPSWPPYEGESQSTTRAAPPSRQRRSASLLLVREAAGRRSTRVAHGRGADRQHGNRTALKLRRAQAPPEGRAHGLPSSGCVAQRGRAGWSCCREILRDDPGHFALTSKPVPPTTTWSDLLGIASDDPIMAGRRRCVEGPRDGRRWRALLLPLPEDRGLVASRSSVFGKMLTASGVAARMPFGARSRCGICLFAGFRCR